MSKACNDNLIKRRRVLLGLGRVGVLAGVCGLAVFRTVKRNRLVRQGKCVGRGACNGCGVYNSCGLPLAIETRQGGGDGR